MADLKVPLKTDLYEKSGKMARPWFDFFNSLIQAGDSDPFGDGASVDVTARALLANLQAADAFDETPIADPANLARRNLPNVFTRPAEFDSTLAVGGPLDPMGPPIQFIAAMTLMGTLLGITGDTAMTGALGVTGDTTLMGDLAITGDTTQTGNVAITGDTTLMGPLAITGNTTQTGTTTQNGNVAITGNLTVSGTVTSSGSGSTPGSLNVTTSYKVAGIKVVGAQGIAIPTPSNTAVGTAGTTYNSTVQSLINALVNTVASQQTAINALRTALQNHGLTL